MDKFPKREDFFAPVLQAIRELGGSGTNEEINDKVIELLDLPAELLNAMHRDTTQTKFEYELAWVRTMLKNQGVLLNSQRGVWSLGTGDTSHFTTTMNPKASQKLEAELQSEGDWKKRINEIIVKHLSASAFERLIQRILREKGFTQVVVTGRSGDGGIDGRGIAKINGILSFHIVFQCKRYTGSISAKEIRDFRGAMVGRTDKGLFITTSSYTRQAIEEATRDGAPAIDLIDGDKLAEKLKELQLGVTVEIKEQVSVNEEWFKNFESL